MTAGRKRPRAPRRRQLTFTPPEGVPIAFDIASLGARFGAQALDLVLTITAVLLLVIALAYAGVVTLGGLVTVGALLFFAIRVPYYVASELFWNGRTLGKRIAGIQVVSADGRALSPHAVTVRNILKEMEVFAPAAYLAMAEQLDGWSQLALAAWLLILLAVPLGNRRRQRLGDILAGTVVVLAPRPVLLPDLAASEAAFRFLPHHLDHYGRYELQTLERLLQAADRATDGRAAARQTEAMGTVATTIAERIDYPDAIPPERARGFLEDFYTAQRAYLETKQLFGDAREDKHHRQAATEP